jgi:undecaprenyl-diphosphatase
VIDRSGRRPDPWSWVGLASLLSFVGLAAILSTPVVASFDDAVGAAVRGVPLPPAWWDAWTWLGGWILIPVGTGATITALRTGHVRLALILAVVLIAGTWATDLVKDAIARPRPPGAELDVFSYSFPSGHTTNSTTAYGLLALVAWRSTRALMVRRIAAGAGVAVPILVGLSRIGLGVHFPSDVLGGWLLGLAFVSLGAVLIGVTGAMTRDRPRSGAAAEPGMPA